LLWVHHFFGGGGMCRLKKNCQLFLRKKLYIQKQNEKNVILFKFFFRLCGDNKVFFSTFIWFNYFERIQEIGDEFILNEFQEMPYIAFHQRTEVSDWCQNLYEVENTKNDMEKFCSGKIFADDVSLLAA
jgi:hypothetical protein